MAVTVVQTAPDKNTKRHWMGSGGVRGTDTYVNAPDQRNSKVRVATLTLTGTYVTGGFALTPSKFGLVEIYGLAVIADGISGAVAVPFLSATGATPNVKLVTDNTATELSNTTSVTNFKFTCVIFGV